MWDLPARTITTYQESLRFFRPGTDGGYVDLKIPQVKRLFTFPDEWRLAGRTRLKQLGNAVAPEFGRALMSALAAVLA